jgi:hypothetical protein
VRDGVGELVQLRVEALCGPHLFLLIRIHEELELVPGHLVFTHPKRGNLHFTLRTLVRLAARLSVGASHGKFAARNRHHVKVTSEPVMVPV